MYSNRSRERRSCCLPRVFPRKCIFIWFTRCHSSLLGAEWVSFSHSESDSVHCHWFSLWDVGSILVSFQSRSHSSVAVDWAQCMVGYVMIVWQSHGHSLDRVRKYKQGKICSVVYRPLSQRVQESAGWLTLPALSPLQPDTPKRRCCWSINSKKKKHL